MKIKLSIVLLALIASQATFAEHVGVAKESYEESYTEDRSLQIMWNPLSLLGLTFGSSFGIRVADKVALVIPLELTYIGGSVTYGDNNQNSASYVFGVNSGLGARFYFSGGAFRDGFYVQPMVNLGWMQFGSRNSAFLVGGTAMLGYSWVWDSGFTLNLAGGARYVYLTTKAEAKNDIFALHGIVPAFEFAIGYSW
ncbi:MAG: hypothetical protein V4534_05040 [Myxococcota bacterium]